MITVLGIIHTGLLYLLLCLVAYCIGYYRGSQAANKKAVADLERAFKGTRMWTKEEAMQMNPEGVWDDLSQAEVDAVEQVAEIIERARMESQNQAVDEQARREELAFVS